MNRMMDWTGQGSAASCRIAVTADDRAALLADLDARLAAGQGFSLATLNLDHVVKLRRDASFRAAYAAQSHVTADGNPIVWLERLAGRRVDLMAGADLMHAVLDLAARHRLPVALLGSTEASLDAAAARIEAAHPGLRVTARIAPAMGFDPEGAQADAAIERLAASGARLCLLALGAPRQEIFAARAQSRLPQTGFLSIGAGIDFISGTQRRAPRLVRALAAEWLWRLLGDPRRLAGRYGACLAILPGLAGGAIAQRLSRAPARRPEAG